jgi:hypothetical protein
VPSKGAAASGVAPAAKGLASIISSKIHLVDLAGSERAKRTGATGARLKESVGINQVSCGCMCGLYDSVRSAFVYVRSCVGNGVDCFHSFVY